MSHTKVMKQKLSNMSVGEVIELKKDRPFSLMRVTVYYAAELVGVKVETHINKKNDTLVVERV